jgi:hypothetical protein
MPQNILTKVNANFAASIQNRVDAYKEISGFSTSSPRTKEALIQSLDKLLIDDQGLSHNVPAAQATMRSALDKPTAKAPQESKHPARSGVAVGGASAPREPSVIVRRGSGFDSLTPYLKKTYKRLALISNEMLFSGVRNMTICADPNDRQQAFDLNGAKIVIDAFNKDAVAFGVPVLASYDRGWVKNNKQFGYSQPFLIKEIIISHL